MTMPQAPSRRRRWYGVAVALLLIGGLGSLLSALPPLYNRPLEREQAAASAAVQVDARQDPARHARQAQAEELRGRFDEAVTMLHAGKYEFAVTALHRVLELSPRMPEGHVNMGYALLGLHEHAAARDFFLGALALNPRQANAYYGLAEAYERLGLLPEAMGAMRTYLHFAPTDEPFLSRARAALWEWDAQLAARRPTAAGDGQTGSAPSSPPAEKANDNG